MKGKKYLEKLLSNKFVLEEYKNEINKYVDNLENKIKIQQEIINRIKNYIEPLITDKDDKECYPINFYVKDVLLSILKEK